eukprot:199019-Chlamydomonas_euryale.AAC.4
MPMQNSASSSALSPACIARGRAGPSCLSKLLLVLSQLPRPGQASFRGHGIGVPGHSLSVARLSIASGHHALTDTCAVQACLCTVVGEWSKRAVGPP